VSLAGPGRPGERPVGGLLNGRIGGRQPDAHVEGHLDVGAEQLLRGHRVLGCEAVLGPVVGRPEPDPQVVGPGAEGEHLVPARVGEKEAGPAGKAGQTAERGDGFGAGAKHQVIGVGQYDLGLQFVEVVGVEQLDRAAGAHGHEARSAEPPARQRDPAGARPAVACLDVELGRVHARPTIMASPKDRNR
jgi:hypothetical protein